MRMVRPGARENLFLAGVIALALMGVAILGFFIWVRASFGVWGVSALPERIPLCNQSYTKRDDRVLTYAEAVGQDSEPSPIVLEPTIGRLPISLAAQPRYDPGAGYYGCGRMVLLHVAEDGYVQFFKLGGP